MKEVEKKFRLYDGSFKAENGKRVKQAYLDFKKDEELMGDFEQILGQEIDFSKIKEARVRQKGEGENVKFFLTLKSDGTLERDEFEAEIDQEKFEELWGRADLGKIEKVRAEIAFENGLVGELDDYEGNLGGLQTLEFEYDQESFDEAMLADAAKMVDGSAEDVTEIKAYKNRNLALRESIDELEAEVKAELEAELEKKMMKEMNIEPSGEGRIS